MRACSDTVRRGQRPHRQPPSTNPPPPPCRSWARNTHLFWSECNRLPCEAPISLGERFVYCFELGFYIQALPVLFFWETKRKDQLEVCAHHVVTVALIAYSYYLKCVAGVGKRDNGGRRGV